MDIEETLEEISDAINNLEKEKNLSKLIKKKETNNTKLDDLTIKLNEIKTKFEENINDNIEIDDEKFEKYISKLTAESDKILKIENLEQQIDEYKKFYKKLNSCKTYLENKKITIVECDKIN